MASNPIPPRREPPPKRRRWRARVFVLGPLGVAAGAAFLGVEPGIAAPLWLAALAWTVFASLAGALVRVFRSGDRSVFRGHRFSEDGGELDEWAARTGRYSWRGEMEDRVREEDRLC